MIAKLARERAGELVKLAEELEGDRTDRLSEETHGLRSALVALRPGRRSERK